MRFFTKGKTSIRHISTFLVFLTGIFASLSGNAQFISQGDTVIVNATVAGSQQRPAVATDLYDNTVIVWESNKQDGDDYGIYAKKVDASGNEVFAETLINTTTASSQRFPDIAMNAIGNYVITWMSMTADSLNWDVYYALYDSADNQLVAEAMAHTSAAGQQFFPKAAMASDGSFAITWHEGGDIFYRLFDAAGTATSGVLTASDKTNWEGYPDIAMDTNGEFVIAWQTAEADGDGFGIYLDAFDNSGASVLDSASVVNTTTSGDQIEPSVAMDSTGNFIVTWASKDQDGSEWGIYARNYTTSAASSNSVYRVNDTKSGSQTSPEVTMSEEGIYVIMWTNYNTSEGNSDVRMKIYNDTYNNKGGEFTVYSDTTGYHQLPAVSLRQNEGMLTMVWQSGDHPTSYTYSDGEAYGVLMQRNQMDDVIDPIAVCQNITVYLDNVGDTQITAEELDGGSTDNKGVASISIPTQHKYLDCGDVPSRNVTLTVTDLSGNTSTCTAVVTVIDTIPPTAGGRDKTIYLDEAGEASIKVSDISNGTSTDNCGVTLSLEKYDFTCDNIGDNEIAIIGTDPSGNVDSALVTVSVVDDIAPVVYTNDITIYLDGAGTGSYTTADVGYATDNCSIQSDSLDFATDLTCDYLGVHTITYFATDAGGNISSQSATLTVLDTVRPTVVTQDISVYLDATGSATIAATDVDNGSTDNCAIDSYSLDQTTFTCNDLDDNTVTLSVTDNSGNVSTATATVTVLDSIAPVALSQNVTVYLDGNGEAIITASDVDNGSSDNCSVYPQVDITAFTCADIGDNTVTLTVFDRYFAGTDTYGGNSATAQATVTVLDTISPTMVANDISIYLDVNGEASITTTDIDNGSSDNCSVPALSLDITSFTCDDLGANAVVLTGTDEYNNSASVSATVTVIDNIAPVVATQDITVQLDENGEVSIATIDIDNGTTDACGFTLSLDQTAFDCSHIGENTVTLTATDGSGNAASLTAKVTVEDNIVPVVAVKDITVQLNGAGNASITASDVDNGTTDNCTLAGVSVDATTFTCDDLGENTVTFTATDGEGNVATTTLTVMVEDILAPELVTQAVTVELDENGLATILASDIENGSVDNCTIVDYSLDITSFTCDDLGANTVTLTVTDQSGNSASKTETVTVIDVIDPEVLTQDITVELDENGKATITPEQIDNGSSDNCSLTLSLDRTSFVATDLGTNTVTLTATDPYGNTSSATAVVTVVDIIAPVVVTQNITVELDANGQATIIESDIDNGSTDNTFIGGYALDINSFSCEDLGNNTVTLTVTDVSGNTASATAVVTVIDVIAPVVTAQDITVELDAIGQVTITPDQIDNGSTDNCSVDLVELDTYTFLADDLGDNTVTLSVTDNSGNVNTSTATVTVIDVIAPVVEMKDITLVLDNSNEAILTAAAIDNGSTDNHYIQSMTVDKSYFTCADLGEQEVTMTVTDMSGNSASATAIVTITEDQLPTVLTQDLTVMLDENGQVEITAAQVDNGSYDNCQVADISLDVTAFTCDKLGANPVTLTVTDTEGNEASAQATVTVTDPIAPVALTQDITLELGANGSATLSAEQIDNGSSDNCSVNLSIDRTDFTCTDIGQQTVILTVADNFGNQDTQPAVVTIVDQLAPVVEVKATTVILNSNGEGSLAVSDIENGSTDNCGIATYAIDKTSFTCEDIGTQTVTLTVTDNQGNVGTNTAEVIVTETILPTILTKNITLELDENGSAVISGEAVDNGSYDNCGIVSYTLDNDTFGCEDLGVNTVTLAVADASGNESSQAAQVIILDRMAPQVVTQNIAIQLGTGNSQVTITPEQVDGGSYDNCTIAGLTLDRNTFGNQDIGEQIVTLTAVDGSGNVSSQQATVLVKRSNRVPEFTSSPELTAIEDEVYEYLITAQDKDNSDELTFSAVTLPSWLMLTDNRDGTATLSGTPADEHVGDHQVEIKVTDLVGSSVTQQFVVSVININDNPVVADQVFEVMENSPHNTLVGQVEVSDPDSENLTFSIISGNPENMFLIDREKGIIYVDNAEALDYERYKSVEMVIGVKDEITSTYATMTINLLNDTDEILGAADGLVVSLKEVALYPNPVSDKLKISSAIFERNEVTLNLYNTIGGLHEVSVDRTAEDEYTLDLSELPRGMYLLMIQVDEQTVMKRVIKQ